MAAGVWAAGGLVKMAARRHLTQDEPGTLGAKVGAAVSL
jgi:hypothetical protein